MKIKCVILLLVFIIYSCNTNDLSCLNEKQDDTLIHNNNSSSFDHINHIRSKTRVGYIDNEPVKPPYFVDYVIENLLDKDEYEVHITDRSLLRKLRTKSCEDDHILILDSLQSGEKCEIEVKTSNFKFEDHSVQYDKKHNYIVEIDGKMPYGTSYSNKPIKELESLVIKIDEKEININIDEYSHIFNPELCTKSGFKRSIEAYEHEDYIYIYIYGGMAAGVYFSKLIFNKSGYITSIIADYGPLSTYGCFNKNFIGF